MSRRTYSIGLGSPVAAPSLTLLGTSSAGTPGAFGTLTHPDAGDFPPITYESNPDRVVNLDNEALIPQYTSTVLTLADRKVIQSSGVLADVECTEVWLGGGAVAAMTTAFWRLLYEYYANPPAFDATSQEYIQWAPAYRTDKVYNVQITEFSTGAGPGADPSVRFDVSDQIPAGGREDGGDTEHGLDAILPPGVRAGMVDQTVTLRMKIISEA